MAKKDLFTQKFKNGGMAPGCSNSFYKIKDRATLVQFHNLPLKRPTVLWRWLAAMKMKTPPVNSSRFAVTALMNKSWQPVEMWRVSLRFWLLCPINRWIWRPNMFSNISSFITYVFLWDTKPGKQSADVKWSWQRAPKMHRNNIHKVDFL